MLSFTPVSCLFSNIPFSQNNGVFSVLELLGPLKLDMGAGVAQSVQCITTERTTWRAGFVPRQRQSIFPLASVSRSALSPTQSPIRWVPGVLSPGVKRGRGVRLTTQPHLVPRSRMSSIPPLPPSASMACSWTALLKLDTVYGFRRWKSGHEWRHFHMFHI
jgi:hypothetical protein